jgi:hypothetical protein
MEVAFGKTISDMSEQDGEKLHEETHNRFFNFLVYVWDGLVLSVS